MILILNRANSERGRECEEDALMMMNFSFFTFNLWIVYSWLSREHLSSISFIMILES